MGVFPGINKNMKLQDDHKIQLKQNKHKNLSNKYTDIYLFNPWPIQRPLPSTADSNDKKISSLHKFKKKKIKKV